MYLDDEKYFVPTKEVAEAAKKGLFLKEKFNKGGTKIGWDRARQLIDMVPISSRDIIRIVSYFARHEVDKKAKNFGNDEDPSKGYIAWLLWGGEPGRKWAEAIKNSLAV